MTETKSREVMRGTLDLLVLKTLSLEAKHGWGISHRIAQLSRGVLEVNQGSLYPALQRLEMKGWIRGKWGHTQEGRRAKYYTLTRTGKKALGAETLNWREYTGAVEGILSSA